MTDMLLSFAQTVRSAPDVYVRPDFTNSLVIKDGRHPVIEALSLAPELIPNDIYLSNSSSLLVISGPNMSGKSTYLQQMALLQIMAQMGLYVPARYASFSICDHLFARAGSDSELETNSSTFMLEAKQIANILLNATPSSFVIVDELGRGTTDLEGSALCCAVCEHLANTGTFCIFATHYPDVSALCDVYPSITSLSFNAANQADGLSGPVVNSHKLSQQSRGPFGADLHSILTLATFAGLPEAVVAQAETIAKDLQTSAQPTATECKTTTYNG